MAVGAHGVCDGTVLRPAGLRGQSDGNRGNRDPGTERGRRLGVENGRRTSGIAYALLCLNWGHIEDLRATVVVVGLCELRALRLSVQSLAELCLVQFSGVITEHPVWDGIRCANIIRATFRPAIDSDTNP